MTSVFRSVSDLAVVAVWTVIASVAVAVGVGGLPRLVLMVPLVIFFPGYALVACFYPGRPDGTRAAFDDQDRSLGRAYASADFLPGPERVGISLVVSIVVTPAVVLAANFSPWGLTLGPVLAGLAGVTLLLVVGGVVARLRLAPEDRYRLPVPQLSWLHTSTDARVLGQQRSFSVWSVAIVVSLLLLTSSVGYALVSPPQSPDFTELYIQSDDVDGDTESLYPSTYTQGESRTLEFAVANHEHETVDYSYIVELQRVEQQGPNAMVTERLRVSTDSLTVEDGGTQNVSVAVTPDRVGSDLRLVVLLYEGDAPSDPSVDNAYRVLRLPIEVIADAGSDSEMSLASERGV